METITFTNIDMEPITLQQLELVKEYYKIYKVDGVLKKIESYDNNQLEDIEYYLSESELVEDVFTAEGTNTISIVTHVPYNQYVIKATTYYRNGIAGAIEKELLNEGKTLCLSETNVMDEIDFQFSRKYFYDENGEEQFSFSYNKDGSLKSISGVGYPFSEYNQTLDAIEIPTYFPNLLTENPYYINFDFLPE